MSETADHYKLCVYYYSTYNEICSLKFIAVLQICVAFHRVFFCFVLFVVIFTVDFSICKVGRADIFILKL